LPSTDGVDLAVRAGFDLVVVDLEHSALDFGAATGLLRHAFALDFPMLVRVPSVDPALVNRLLEAGAAGIQLSTVQSRAAVSALIAASRYPPAGERSVSLAHPAARGSALADYLAAEADSPPLLVAQIETAATLDPLPSLLRGVDVAFVGTTDLSVRVPDVAARVDEVADAARAAGVAFGGWLPAAADLARLRLADARYLLVGSDFQMLGSAMRSAVAAFKE
jgi:4-hydroxy-2-oxoheptanedioate aldolase